MTRETQNRNCYEKKLQYCYCRFQFVNLAKAETLALGETGLILQFFPTVLFVLTADVDMAKNDIINLMVGKLSSSI